eukprot:CFRG2591T1
MTSADAKITTRDVVKEDFELVKWMSQGVYGKHDYLLDVFDKWLVESSRNIRGVEYDGKLVGLVSKWKMPNSESEVPVVLSQAARIHKDYRGKGLSHIMSTASMEQACRIAGSTFLIRLAINASTSKHLIRAEEEKGLHHIYSQNTIGLNNEEVLGLISAATQHSSIRSKNYRQLTATELYALLQNNPAPKRPENNDRSNRFYSSKELLVLDWSPYNMCLESLIHLENSDDNVVFVGEVAGEGESATLVSYSAAATIRKNGERYVTICTNFANEVLSEEAFRDVFLAHVNAHDQILKAVSSMIYCHDYMHLASTEDRTAKYTFSCGALGKWMTKNVTPSADGHILRRASIAVMEKLYRNKEE